MRRIVAAWALALAAAPLACSGCHKNPPPPADAAPAASAGALTPEEAAQVLARVGDRSITLGDFVSAIEHMDQFDRVRYQAPERRKELLNEMIDVMLLADEAREQGYDQDPTTKQEVREILRDAYLKKVRSGLPGPSEISADEVSAYYDAHKADFHDPERRRVSAIVLNSQAAAEAALAAVTGGTSQFGDLVRSKSVDPQAKANVPVDLAGDLGFVSPPGDPRGANARVPEEVRAAAFQIGKVGDVLSSVVKSGTKFYVVKLGGKTDPHDRTLKDAERSIRVRLSQDKIHAKEEAAIDELRKQFPVKIDEQALSTVQVDLPSLDGGVDGR
jgi:peptidyl-prolyl cis-trans isomerase C